MNKTRFLSLAGAGLVSGALLLGSVGAVGAQTPADPTFGGGRGHGPIVEQGAGQHGLRLSQHGEVQAVVAKALGLTTEELQAQLAAGKTVPQIAQERGVDFANVQAAVQAEHQANGRQAPRQGHQGGGPAQGAACPIERTAPGAGQTTSQAF